MELHNYGKGILHVVHSDPEELAYAFLRVQESSGNPEWAGRIFSTDQFLEWYNQAREKDGRWEYHREYVGFTVPSSAFKPFYEGRFDPISELENGLLKLLSRPTNNGRKKAFVIGSTEGDIPTMDHELSCALFHVDPSYRRETLSIIKGIPTGLRKKMDKWFIDDGTYSCIVIPREIVAEFADWRDSYMFREARIDRRDRTLQRIHRQIRLVFKEGLKTLKI